MPFVKDFLFIAEPRPVGFTMFHFLFLFKHAMLSGCAATLELAWASAQGARTEQNRTCQQNHIMFHSKFVIPGTQHLRT